VGVDYARVSIDRSTLPDDLTQALSLTIDLSLDGGVTWAGDEKARTGRSFGVFPVTVRTTGGSVYPDGTPIPSQTATFVPEPRNAQRMVRAEITATKALRCRVDVQIKGEV